MSPRDKPTDCLPAKKSLKRNTLLWWGVGIGAGMLVMCCGGVGVIGVVLIRSSSGSTVKGRYPAPVSRYQGRTAEQWFGDVMDADANVCESGCRGLNGLGSEGVPFLLRGIIRFQKTKQPFHLQHCLIWCDGTIVKDEDLPLFVSLLKDDTKGYGGSTRQCALRVLKAAGKRAKPYSSAIREMLRDTDPFVLWEVEDTLHTIDPEHEPMPRAKPELPGIRGPG